MTEREWLANTNSVRMIQFLGRPSRERKMTLFCAACCRRVAGLLTEPHSVQVLDTLERFADGEATREEVRAAELGAMAAAAELGAPFIGARSQEGLETATNVSGTEFAIAERRYWAASAVYSAAYSARLMGPEPVIVRGFNLVLEGPHPLDRMATPELTAAQCQHALREDQPGIGRDTYGVDASRLAESRFQAAVLRCVVGNPFRPRGLDPAALAWRAGNGRTVADLATAAYEERVMPGGLLDTAQLAVLADALEDVGCTDQEILGHLRSPGPHVRGCWALDVVLLKQ
jgi:hypothetical protein